MICICLSTVGTWHEIRFRIYFYSKLLLVAATWTRLTNYVSVLDVLAVCANCVVVASDLCTLKKHSRLAPK